MLTHASNMAAILYVCPVPPLILFAREQGTIIPGAASTDWSCPHWRAPTNRSGTRNLLDHLGVYIATEKLNSLTSSGGSCGRASELVAPPQYAS